MTVAKLNHDDMGKGLSRADLRSGDSMVVLFQRPSRWMMILSKGKVRRTRRLM
jgi:hypothetical protein